MYNYCVIFQGTAPIADWHAVQPNWHAAGACTVVRMLRSVCTNVVFSFVVVWFRTRAIQ